MILIIHHTHYTDKTVYYSTASDSGIHFQLGRIIMS